MKKSDLAKMVQGKNPQYKLSEIEVIVDVMFGAIKNCLKKKEKIEVRNFGNFHINDKKSRQSINPKTGEKIFVPAKKTAHFKVGKKLFDNLNG